MLIRAEQMQAMSRALEDAFVKRMVKHLCDGFPRQLEVQGLKEKDLEAMVRKGIMDAKQYDVIYENEIEKYIECMVILNPKFDKDPEIPWAVEILRRTNINGREKMEEISNHLIFKMDDPITDLLIQEEPNE